MGVLPPWIGGFPGCRPESLTPLHSVGGGTGDRQRGCPCRLTAEPRRPHRPRQPPARAGRLGKERRPPSAPGAPASTSGAAARVASVSGDGCHSVVLPCRASYPTLRAARKDFFVGLSFLACFSCAAGRYSSHHRETPHATRISTPSHALDHGRPSRGRAALRMAARPRDLDVARIGETRLRYRGIRRMRRMFDVSVRNPSSGVPRR